MSFGKKKKKKTKAAKKALCQQKKHALSRNDDGESYWKKSWTRISLCLNTRDFLSINSVKFMSGTLISCTFYEPTLWKATSIRLWRQQPIIATKEKQRLLVTERGSVPLRSKRLVRMQMWAVPLKVAWETTAVRPQNPPRICRKKPISLKIAKN